MTRLSWIFLALAATSLTAGSRYDTLLLPDAASSPGRARMSAYLLSSLAPLVPREAAPSTEELLEQAPFRRDGSRLALALEDLHPGARAALVEAAAKREPVHALEFLELFAGALPATMAARPVEAELGALRDRLDVGGERWHAVDVQSVVSRGGRRIWYRGDHALDRALAGPEGRLPVGSAFLAEHFDDAGAVVETHVTEKRSDHQWDLTLYDAEGVRKERSDLHPMRFRAPVTCAGCHLSRRRLPPFTDFPEPSRDFQGFVPEVEVELSPQEEGWVHGFGAPRDQLDPEPVLGRYAGLAAVHLMRARDGGTLQPWQAARAEAVAAALAALGEQ
jgi:hypothetical protein